eukprot:4691764-Alexandrium_andersonii.AAC.1
MIEKVRGRLVRAYHAALGCTVERAGRQESERYNGMASVWNACASRATPRKGARCNLAWFPRTNRSTSPT